MDDQNPDQPGITAYHGSPHEFDKFDISKIGTGEGAQSYGHGLYFAEHEPVAKSYRDTLSVAKAINDLPGYTQGAAKLIQRKGDAGEQMFRQHYDDLGPEKVEQAIKDAKETIANAPKGHMYEVHINAHPDHFLDWDAPLNQQTGRVKHFLELSSKLDGKPIENITGEQWLKNLGVQFLQEGAKNPSAAISEHLKRQGISGIKYLDQGSRSSEHKGTRNYVVFDDKLVNVRRKYKSGGRVGYDGGGSTRNIPGLTAEPVRPGAAAPTADTTVAAAPTTTDTAAADAASQTAGYNASDQNASAVTPQTNDSSSSLPIYLQPFDFSKYDNTAAAGMAYYSQFMPTAGAAIMMGNGAVESYNPNTQIGFDPSVKQVGGGSGNGFFQWGSDPASGRWTNNSGNPNTMGLVQFAQTYGFDPNSAEAQFRFPLYEMTVNPTYKNKGILEDLQNATPDNIESGTESFMNDYEGAGDTSSLDDRVDNANNLLQYAQNGYSLNGLDPDVSKALNPFTQVPTTQTYAFKEPGTSTVNVTGVNDTQGPNVATTGITDLKNITGSDTTLSNEATDYITNPTVTNDPFSGVMSSNLNLGDTSPVIGDTGLSTDANQIQTNSTGITGQDIIPYGTGLDLNNGTMGVSSNGISNSPMLTGIDTGFNPSGNYGIDPGGGLGLGGFGLNSFDAGGFKHGGFVNKALEIVRRAAGGQVDMPSVPVTPNKYQDLRRRMLETPPPVNGQQEDQESRKFQYLQNAPGPQIRDFSFANGGVTMPNYGLSDAAQRAIMLAKQRPGRR